MRDENYWLKFKWNTKIVMWFKLSQYGGLKTQDYLKSILAVPDHYKKQDMPWKKTERLATLNI